MQFWQLFRPEERKSFGYYKLYFLTTKSVAHLLSVVLFCLFMHVPFRPEAVIKILTFGFSFFLRINLD